MRALGLLCVGAVACDPAILQWRTSASTDLGPVSLSPQTPEFGWDVRIIVGEALVANGFELASAVVVEGVSARGHRPEGGDQTLEIEAL